MCMCVWVFVGVCVCVYVSVRERKREWHGEKVWWCGKGRNKNVVEIFWCLKDYNIIHLVCRFHNKHIDDWRGNGKGWTAVVAYRVIQVAVIRTNRFHIVLDRVRIVEFVSFFYFSHRMLDCHLYNCIIFH